MPQKTAQISIAEDYPGASVNAYELSYFLYLFRGAYVLALEHNLDLGKERKRDFYKFQQIAIELGGLGFASKARKNLPTELELEFTDFSKNSPLKIIAIATSASLAALTAAVILSGGKANLTSGEFEVPPLGHGIRQLKEALGQRPPAQLPSEKKAKQRNQPKDIPRSAG